MTLRIKPNETLRHEDLEVTHLGYGHKITEKGDLSYGELRLRAVGGPASEPMYVRVSTPLDRPQATTFAGWIVTVTRCEDHGPPHDSNAVMDLLLQRASSGSP